MWGSGFVGGLGVRHPKRIDLVSLLSGVLAIPLAALAVQLRSVRVPGSGRVQSNPIASARGSSTASLSAPSAGDIRHTLA